MTLTLTLINPHPEACWLEAGFTCALPNGTTAVAPIGAIQLAGKAWSEQLPQGIGTHLTQVAVVLDFFAGFTPPRQLYSSDVYRVWGTLPYDKGDFWTHALFDLLYPGYEKSSYYHDEVTPS